MAAPSVEVIARVHRASGALALAHRPVLRERRGALNGRGIVASGLVNVVVGSIRVDGPHELRARAGVVVTKVFEDVVLGKRVRGPSVHRQVRVPVGGPRARVVDGAITSDEVRACLDKAT